jgi:hypothetical protein
LIDAEIEHWWFSCRVVESKVSNFTCIWLPGAAPADPCPAAGVGAAAAPPRV